MFGELSLVPDDEAEEYLSGILEGPKTVLNAVIARAMCQSEVTTVRWRTCAGVHPMLATRRWCTA